MEIKKVLIWGAGVLVMFWLLEKCNESKEVTADQILASASKQQNANASTVVSSADTGEVIPTAKWLYSNEEDKMTSRKMYYAQLTANNELVFDFPYDGGSVATLTIRKKRGEVDVMLKISKGQFIHDYEGGSIKVRFGNTKPGIYAISKPSDYSSDLVFIDNASRFISNLKKYKKLLIEAEFYNEGIRQMEFDIEGFKWDH
jgi:hypothetical protein